MGRSTFTDGQGNSYIRSSVTVYLPLDLLEFWMDENDQSERAAVKRIKQELLHRMGACLTEVGVGPRGVDEPGVGFTEVPDYQTAYSDDERDAGVGDPSRFWQRDNEVVDLQSGTARHDGPPILIEP